MAEDGLLRANQAKASAGMPLLVPAGLAVEMLLEVVPVELAVELVVVVKQGLANQHWANSSSAVNMPSSPIPLPPLVEFDG